MSATAAKVVDQSSIHAQFSILQGERDQLRIQVVNLERSRRQEEQTLLTLRQTHQRLGQELRVSNDALGGLNDKRQALSKEQERLKLLVHDEKQELIRLTEELEAKFRDEQQDKQAFIQEMDSINSEIDRYIKAYEEFQTKRSITSNVISLLLKEPRVQQDDKLKRELYAKYEGLCTAESEWAARQTEFERAQNQVSQLRQEAMIKANDAGQCLGERELDELEQVWDLSWQQQEMTERHSPTGRNSEEILFHDDESEKIDHYNQSVHEARKEFGNSAANMELFYGSTQ